MEIFSLTSEQERRGEVGLQRSQKALLLFGFERHWTEEELQRYLRRFGPINELHRHVSRERRTFSVVVVFE